MSKQLNDGFMGQRARISELNLWRARLMRRDPTAAEALLWDRLRDRRLHGLKFRRQFPFDGFILDFYCAAAKVVVELDGVVHLSKARYDFERTTWLEVNEMQVVRFPNHRVFDGIVTVLQEISTICLARSRK